MKSEAHKRHVWDFFELSQCGEVDPKLLPFFWHWLMYPMVELLGPELVYAIGLQALEYPPTWVDTKSEVAQVEAAITLYFEGV